MDKKIAEMLDVKTAVFVAEGKQLLQDEMNLRTVAYMLGDVLLPMCCMVCNTGHLERILSMTKLCADNAALQKKLAKLIYDYLAQCNGL